MTTSPKPESPEPLKVPEELLSIQQALANGPSKGPWRASFDGHGGMRIESLEWQIGYASKAGGRQEANAALIAACNPNAVAKVLAYIAAIQAARNEAEAMRADAERLDFMCSKVPLRFIEGNDDMWRVYQDEAPPEACTHKWRAIVSLYHPTAREAIDAAMAAMKGDAHA